MSKFSKQGFGRKPFGKKEMHKAQCATCGNECEVPFRPNGSKPVYCNDCFKRDDSPRGPRQDFSPRQSFHNDRPNARPDQAFNDLKAELRVVNQNLERLIMIMTPAPKAEKSAKAEKPAKTSKKKIAKK